MKIIVERAGGLTAAALLVGLAWSTAATASQTAAGGQDVWSGIPDFAIPPPLHPGGIELETRQLGDGVYALLSNHPAVDNSGFIIGERGVLVIDAHINGEMAQQIIDAVRRVTDKPILYLVNTNYHGDHTFGNYKFPATTTIVAHRRTAERMRHFDHEKTVLLPTVNGDESVFADVKLRLPDVVFDERVRIELGGRHVELYFFGPGNTPGDLVVYEPETRTAWTGNLVVGEGTIPPMFENGAKTYLKTLANLRATLDVNTIVPGHGAVTGEATLARYLRYVSELIGVVGLALQQGQTVEQLIAGSSLDPQYLSMIPPALPELAAFIEGLHKLNLAQTYRELGTR